MEIIGIIFILWLIGCAFPGSDGGAGNIHEGIGSLIAGVIVFGGLYLYWALGVVGIDMLGQWLGWNHSVTMILALFGPIVGPMLIVSVVKAALFYRRARASRLAPASGKTP